MSEGSTQYGPLGIVGVSGNNELIDSLMQVLRCQVDGDASTGMRFEIYRTLNGWEIIPKNILTALILDEEHNHALKCKHTEKEYSTESFNYRFNNDGAIIKEQITMECKWTVEF